MPGPKQLLERWKERYGSHVAGIKAIREERMDEGIHVFIGHGYFSNR